MNYAFGGKAWVVGHGLGFKRKRPGSGACELGWRQLQVAFVGWIERRGAVGAGMVEVQPEPSGDVALLWQHAAALAVRG